MKSKIITGIILFVTLFSIVGCSDGKVETSAADTQEVSTGDNEVQESLLVYAGAGLRKPLDEIGEVFKEKYGVTIEYSYAGSAQSLSQIELSQEGDLFLPGAYLYIESAKEKGFIEEEKNIVYHIPVIGVPKGNPANITCLEDMAKEGIKVVLGDERSAAIGKVAQKLFKEKGILETVEKNVVSKDATVNEVMVHVTMAQADACIIWEDNVNGTEEVEMIQIPAADNDIKTIPVSILSFTKKPEPAQAFFDFVCSDEAKLIFQKHGFKTVE